MRAGNLTKKRFTKMQEREFTFSEYLDKEQKNKLFVRFVYSEDFSKIDAFVVSQMAIMGEKPTEIIRFDASLKETTNVHRFYRKPPTKNYLNKEKTMDTLEDFIRDIMENWHDYRLKYKENHL